MPPPRKVDLLPADLREWLREALVARGFGGYEDLADELNRKLALSGSTMTIRKSALHGFGSKYQQFIKLQEEAGDWVQGFVSDIGIEGEADRHGALFQMLTALAFKTMKSAMEDEAPDPKNLAYLGKMMKDIMSSSGVREKLLDAERARIREEERQAAAESAERSAVQLGFSADMAAQLRRGVLGTKG